MSDIILPTKPTKSQLVNPETLLIFGKPKIGKSTAIAGLKDCLLINLEDKVQTVDGMVMYAEDNKKLEEILDKIIEAGCPYKYIAIDTITKLEENCLPEATNIYRKLPIGKEWVVIKDGVEDKKSSRRFKYNNNILNLPNGSGYQFVSQALTKVLNKIKKAAPHIIFIGHVKEINLLKDGAEFTSSDLNLTGKNKQRMSADAQAIAYMSRIGKKNYLEFKSGQDVLAGCKIKRLEGKEILISEYDENDNLITHWDQIYIEEKTK